ncbi:hypothetical protein BO70DRAFT_230137 [Aspergillus heteromorphus CBS 117.55]|uniref:Secreted protein n=1 Tax=Aspergillus heteromorphus CBS 117.55 TaxID=1448321 RepID=A0A317WEP1_9EURO|nr:uncharacterized protein BO70DRAFT_230137 [Aspergillus heteromorphus CBS 117.55]PWY84904.1 hypothetical protein BO70DRAFT_230137 [Aspergillus heteromorphus CBS 117.55]
MICAKISAGVGSLSFSLVSVSLSVCLSVCLSVGMCDWHCACACACACVIHVDLPTCSFSPYDSGWFMSVGTVSGSLLPFGVRHRPGLLLLI